MWREVTNLPSLPKKGELLIVNNILIVGWSISVLGNASGFSKSAIVSPISNPSIPVIAQISPQGTFSTWILPIPSNTCNSLILTFLVEPSALHNI